MSPKNSPRLADTHEGTLVRAASPAETDSLERYGGMIDGHIPLSDIGVKAAGSDTGPTTTTGSRGLLPLPPLGEVDEDSLDIICILLAIAGVFLAYQLFR